MKEFPSRPSRQRNMVVPKAWLDLLQAFCDWWQSCKTEFEDECGLPPAGVGPSDLELSELYGRILHEVGLGGEKAERFFKELYGNQQDLYCRRSGIPVRIVLFPFYPQAPVSS